LSNTRISMSSKTIEKKIYDKDLLNSVNNLFNSADPAIIRKKYYNLKVNLKLYIVQWVKLKEKILKPYYNNVDEMCANIDSNVNVILQIDFLPKTAKDQELINHYKKIKDLEDIQDIILICTNLIKYKQDIMDKDPTFLEDNELMLFNINIRELWDKTRDKTVKKEIMFILKYLLTTSLNIYENITSADVDSSALKDFVLSSLNTIKKQIPRCDDAFRIIENSMDLMDTNFDGYYKDFVQTSNPYFIVENFVKDVSSNVNKGKKSTRLTYQFNKIITFFTTKINGKMKNNSKVKGMFEKLTELQKML